MMTRSKATVSRLAKRLWPALVVTAALLAALLTQIPLRVEQTAAAQTTDTVSGIFFGVFEDTTLRRLNPTNCGVEQFSAPIPGVGFGLQTAMAVEPDTGANAGRRGRIIVATENADNSDNLVLVERPRTTVLNLGSPINPIGLAFDRESNPNFYFIDETSADNPLRRIRIFQNVNGVITPSTAPSSVLFTETESGANAIQPFDIGFHPTTGDLYFLAFNVNVGAIGTDQIYYLAKTGPGTFSSTPQLAFTFTGAAEASEHLAIEFDSAGNLYVSSLTGGTDTGTIVKLTPSPTSPKTYVQSSVSRSGLGDIVDLAMSPNNILVAAVDASFSGGSDGSIFVLNTTDLSNFSAPCTLSMLNPTGVAVFGNIGTTPEPEPVCTINTPTLPSNLSTSCTNAAANSTAIRNFIAGASATTSCGDPVTVTATAPIGANGATVTLTPTTTNTFPVGTTTVTFTFTGTGRAASQPPITATRTVTITSDLAAFAPAAGLTTSCTIDTPAPGGTSIATNQALASFLTPSATGFRTTGGCPPVTLVSTTAQLGGTGAAVPVTSTTVFPVGTSNVTLTFRDATGATASATSTVTVNPAPPVVRIGGTVIPPAGGTVTVTTACLQGATALTQLQSQVTATVACGPTPTRTFQINGVPVTSTTLFPFGATPIQLRVTSGTFNQLAPPITVNVLFEMVDPSNGNRLLIDVVNQRFTFTGGGVTVTQSARIFANTTSLRLRSQGPAVADVFVDGTAGFARANLFINGRSFHINTTTSCTVPRPRGSASRSTTRTRTR